MTRLCSTFAGRAASCTLGPEQASSESRAKWGEGWRGDATRLARMPPGDMKERVAQLAATLSSVEAVLDLDGMRKQLAALEEEAADPDLWSDQERAQSV